MADPLSLLASLLAVATAGIEVSKTLCKLADIIGNSNEEIRSISEEVSAFSRIIGDLHEFLEDAKDLISSNASQNARHILIMCEGIFAKIKRMLQFSKRKYGNNFWQGMQWSFRRDKVKPLCAKLESYKSTLVIMLSVMKLAKCKKMMSNDVSQIAVEKEQRYRANLETDILHNSAAIVRWQQAEVQFEAMHNGNMYYNHPKPICTAPIEEIQWLSALVPYKPPKSELTPSQHRLSEVLEDPRRLDEEEQLQLVETVDLLLTKWTTLFHSAKSRETDLTGKAVHSSRYNKSSDSARLKSLSAAKQTTHGVKPAENSWSTGRKETKATRHRLQGSGRFAESRQNAIEQAFEFPEANAIPANISPTFSGTAQVNSTQRIPISTKTSYNRRKIYQTDNASEVRPTARPYFSFRSLEPDEAIDSDGELEEIVNLKPSGASAGQVRDKSDEGESLRNDVSKKALGSCKSTEELDGTSSSQDVAQPISSNVKDSAVFLNDISAGWATVEETSVDDGRSEVVTNAREKHQKSRKDTSSTSALPSLASTEREDWPPWNTNSPFSAYPTPSQHMKPPPQFAPYSSFMPPYPSTSLNIPPYGSYPPAKSQGGYSFQPLEAPFSHSHAYPALSPITMHTAPSSILDPGPPATTSPQPLSIPNPVFLRSTSVASGNEDPIPSHNDRPKYAIDELIGLIRAATNTTYAKPLTDAELRHAKNILIDANSRGDGGLNDSVITPPMAQPKRARDELDGDKGERLTKNDIYVNLKDPFGKIFKLPYRMCTTWAEMKVHIQDAFANAPNAERYRHHVQTGSYDLSDENDAIILPKAWESIIEDHRQTGLNLVMHMWPMLDERMAGMWNVPRTFTSSSAPSIASPHPEPRTFHHRHGATTTEIEDERQSTYQDDDSDDVADELDADDLDWRNGLSHRLAENDERFQKTWETEMKRSQAKVEHKMLEHLLKESKAKIEDLDSSSDERNGENQSQAEERAPLAIEGTDHGAIRSTAHTETAANGRESVNSISSNSPEQDPRRATSLPIVTPALPETVAMNSPLAQTTSNTQEQQNKPQQDLLEAKLLALEDANQRAESAAAKAHTLEQKLKQLEEVVARHGFQTPPATPTMPQSSLTLDTGASPSLRQSSGKEDSVRTKSTISFRKRFFGRHRSSSGIMA